MKTNKWIRDIQKLPPTKQEEIYWYEKKKKKFNLSCLNPSSRFSIKCVQNKQPKKKKTIKIREKITPPPKLKSFEKKFPKLNKQEKEKRLTHLCDSFLSLSFDFFMFLFLLFFPFIYFNFRYVYIYIFSYIRADHYEWLIPFTQIK